MAESRHIINLSNQQLIAVRALIQGMRPPLTRPGRPQCALFLTIVEQFEAALLLAQAGLATHGATHVRSMLEALVAFRLLGKDATYVDQMQFDQLIGEKRLYTRLLALPQLPTEQRPVLEARLDGCLARYQPLFDKNIRASKITEQFGPAGLAEMIGPYTMLCSFAHNDLAALAQRHQASNSMALRVGDTHEIMYMVMSLAHYVLVEAARTLNNIALFPEEHFEPRFAVMARIHTELMELMPVD